MSDSPIYRGQAAPSGPGAGGGSSALTDSQLRASAVPVTGSFSVTGSSVSISNWPSGWNVAVTNFPSTQAVSGTVTVGNASLAVTGAFYPATQPVSGTFWQATQPVSIAQTVAVSGTFWQATQPVSIATMPTTPVTGTFWQATQPVSVAATLATKDLKDTGRTLFSAATVIAGVTAVTTEAMLSVVPTRAGVAGSAATSIQATSGKTLRLTAIVFSTRSTSAAVISGRCALRMNPGGAAVATSPIIAILSCTQQAAALAEGGDNFCLPLPDGIEISGTQQVGLSQVCSATTGVVYASIIGYEY